MSHILRIDSRDKTNPTSSNSNFVINTVPIHVKTARVKQVVLPNIFNNIRNAPSRDANNLFSYETGGSPAFFTITPGFYDLVQLLEAVNTQLTGASVELVFNEITGLITINNTGADFSLINKTDGNSMADVLGIVTSEVVTGGSSVTLGGKPNLFNYSIVYVSSKRISNGFNLTDPKGRFPVIACVPIDVPYGGSVVYEVQEQHQIDFMVDTPIDEIDIQIVNHHGEPIDIPNNHHVQILIEYDGRLVK